jgi:hypothetical protein
MRVKVMLRVKFWKELFSLTNGHASNIRMCADCEFTPTLRMCEYHQQERSMLVRTATNKVISDSNE